MRAMSPTAQSRAIETRSRLLAAGRVAFSHRGYDAVNLTSDILEPAGVSVGSFYHQFADKTELLIAILDQAATDRKASVFLHDTADSRKRSLDTDIAGAMERFFLSLDDGGHLWRIQIRERNNTEPRIRERILDGRRAWRQEITQLLAPHNRHDDNALAQAVELIVIFCIGLISAYLDLPPDARAARRNSLPRQVSDFLCRGVRPLLGAPTPRTRKR